MLTPALEARLWDLVTELWVRLLPSVPHGFGASRAAPGASLLPDGGLSTDALLREALPGLEPGYAALCVLRGWLERGAEAELAAAGPLPTPSSKSEPLSSGHEARLLERALLLVRCGRPAAARALCADAGLGHWAAVLAAAEPAGIAEEGDAASLAHVGRAGVGHRAALLNVARAAREALLRGGSGTSNASKVTGSPSLPSWPSAALLAWAAHDFDGLLELLSRGGGGDGSSGGGATTWEARVWVVVTAALETRPAQYRAAAAASVAARSRHAGEETDFAAAAAATASAAVLHGLVDVVEGLRTVAAPADASAYAAVATALVQHAGVVLAALAAGAGRAGEGSGAADAVDSCPPPMAGWAASAELSAGAADLLVALRGAVHSTPSPVAEDAPVRATPRSAVARFSAHLAAALVACALPTRAFHTTATAPSPCSEAALALALADEALAGYAVVCHGQGRLGAAVAAAACMATAASSRATLTSLALATPHVSPAAVALGLYTLPWEAARATSGADATPAEASLAATFPAARALDVCEADVSAAASADAVAGAAPPPRDRLLQAGYAVAARIAGGALPAAASGSPSSDAAAGAFLTRFDDALRCAAATAVIHSSSGADGVARSPVTPFHSTGLAAALGLSDPVLTRVSGLSYLLTDPARYGLDALAAGNALVRTLLVHGPASALAPAMQLLFGGFPPGDEGAVQAVTSLLATRPPSRPLPQLELAGALAEAAQPVLPPAFVAAVAEDVSAGQAALPPGPTARAILSEASAWQALAAAVAAGSRGHKGAAAAAGAALAALAEEAAALGFSEAAGATLLLQSPDAVAALATEGAWAPPGLQQALHAAQALLRQA